MCEELGYSVAMFAIKKDHFGEGTGPVWDVSCVFVFWRLVLERFPSLHHVPLFVQSEVNQEVIVTHLQTFSRALRQVLVDILIEVWCLVYIVCLLRDSPKLFLCLWSYVTQLKTALLVWIILRAITSIRYVHMHGYFSVKVVSPIIVISMINVAQINHKYDTL